jgi:hypothetical protein
MVDATLRSIYSAADETVADLDRLHLASQAKRGQYRANLDAVVARLDWNPPAGDPEVVPERRGRADEDRGRTPADPPPFVALPQRTTHGGPWGPKMREKLTAEALAKRLW